MLKTGQGQRPFAQLPNERVLHIRSPVIGTGACKAKEQVVHPAIDNLSDLAARDPRQDLSQLDTAALQLAKGRGRPVKHTICSYSVRMAGQE